VHSIFSEIVEILSMSLKDIAFHYKFIKYRANDSSGKRNLLHISSRKYPIRTVKKYKNIAMAHKRNSRF